MSSATTCGPAMCPAAWAATTSPLLLPNMKPMRFRPMSTSCAGICSKRCTGTMAGDLQHRRRQPPRQPEDFDTLLRQADELMYEVKRSGRDRILLREY